MSGQHDAVLRCLAHEARRQHRRLPPEERDFIRGREEQVVRWMNQVDRAVRRYRRYPEDEAA